MFTFNLNKAKDSDSIDEADASESEKDNYVELYVE
jgi:hypothetical protein